MGEKNTLTRLAAVPDPVALLSALFQHAPVAFQICSAAGQVVLVNDAFRELFGSAPPPDYNILEDDIAEAQGILANIRLAFTGETVHVGPFWYDPRDLAHVKVTEGRRVAIEATFFPLRNDAGTVTHVATAFKDVTAEAHLREKEQAVWLAEERLRRVTDNAPVTLFSLDSRGVYTFAAGSRLTTANLKPEDLVGCSVFSLTNEERVDGMMRRGLAGEALSFRGSSVAGAYECRLIPERLSDGEVTGLTGISFDISEQERAEAALKKGEERLQLALEAGRMVALESDFATDTLSFSMNVKDVLGITPEELRSIGSLGALVHPEDAEATRQATARAKAGDFVEVNFRAVRPDNGEVVWLERRAVLLTDEAGKATGTRGVIIDVTERKRAEQRTEEIRARSAELELQNHRVEQANRLKSEFLANMSHELRTPLNAIIGFSELLHDGIVDPSTPKYKEFLFDILTSGRHLLQLINDVLDLSKVEAGKLEFHPEPLDPRAVVREVAGILRTLAAEKRIRVETDFDDALGEVCLDPARLKQLLYNYVSNALKFTEEGGSVVVRTRVESATTFRIEVEDTGIGIAAPDLGRIFVEFQQLDAGATKRHAGTGLGLALSRRLVEAQGGSVGVRSTHGVGSVFHAVLPRDVAPTRPQSTAPPRRSEHPFAPLILVVEDEPAEQAVLVDALSAAGYGVEVARTGTEALRRCQERSFDAVTLDLILPDMSGLDVLPGLRASGPNRKTPVVVVTMADKRVVSGHSVHDVLSKPLDASALLASLERAGVVPNPSHDVLVVDDDPGALRLMAATLEQLGYGAICRPSAVLALKDVAHTTPVAIVLDLVMPEMNGFEFLDELRKRDQWARVPVIVWTLKDLTPEERAKLTARAETVLAKESGAAHLFAELEAVLPRRKEKEP